MANSIRQFYNIAQQRDFARLFQFQLESFGNLNFDDNEYVYLETATLPGRSVTNIPVTYMGMDFNTPGTVKYQGSASYKVTFRCDAKYQIRSALEAASFDLFDETRGTGSYGLPNLGSTLIMGLYDNSGIVRRRYTLYGVWVQALDDTTYDVKDGGTIQTIGCTLAYQFWRPTKGGTNTAMDSQIPDLAQRQATPGDTRRRLASPIASRVQIDRNGN